MSNGRYCDNCETHLNDEDYVSYGSWSYTCHDCGFSYRHGSANVGEQVEKFNSRPTKLAPDVLRACDMGEVAGVKLTYVNGSVFATPAKRG